MKLRSAIFLILLLPAHAWAQEGESQETEYAHKGHTHEPVYAGNQAWFDPIVPTTSTAYRSFNGAPGAEYWQNSADYAINVTLDEDSKQISGDITITYTNNSPFALDYLWMLLEQNKFAETSRGTLMTPANGSRFDASATEGYGISDLEVKLAGDAYSPSFLINDTRMQVRLKEPLESGKSADISLKFTYDIPEKGADRMGWISFDKGTVYQLAQWYPRMCVFDDVKGWNTEPYLGAGEFYQDYGDFVVNITAPWDHIVVANGELANEKDVLTKDLLSRLEKAYGSDETVMLIGKDEVGKTAMTRPTTSGTLTWEYRLENSRDFAWASSKAFIWDAARINLPSGGKCLAQSAYTEESHGKKGWSRSTEYTKFSIEHYSGMWFEYPYPDAVNVAGTVAGMEYPGVSFCAWDSKTEGLWGVTDHEFGHNWFPMIVGSNERLYAWMDEGFNTFINYYSTKAFNDGEYFSPRHFAHPRFAQFYQQMNQTISTFPDVMLDNEGMNLGILAYYKPAAGLFMLREYVLGQERFDYAFRTYINRWAYKHPTPMDFFNTMEDAAGEELDWFWRGWFLGGATIDLSLDEMSYVGETAAEGALLTLSNPGSMPMPAQLEITYEDGASEIITLPVETWFRGSDFTAKLPTTKPIRKVVVDPDQLIMDVDRSDNEIRMGSE